MNETNKALQTIFTEEYELLLHIRNFLLLLPQLMANSRLQEMEPFNFMETNEVRCRDLLQRKQIAMAAVATELGVPVSRITFTLLAQSDEGSEFAALGLQLNQMARELSFALLKSSIYLKNFSHLNQSLQRLVDMFQSRGYSREGQRMSEKRYNSVIQEA